MLYLTYRFVDANPDCQDQDRSYYYNPNTQYLLKFLILPDQKNEESTLSPRALANKLQQFHANVNIVTGKQESVLKKFMSNLVENPSFEEIKEIIRLDSSGVPTTPV